MRYKSGQGVGAFLERVGSVEVEGIMGRNFDVFKIID